MSIQLSGLTVTDPLAEQEVTVVIRVLPDNAQRPARTALVSVGTAGRPPVFVSGVLDDVADLIRQAWLAYGVQVEVWPGAPGDVATEVETVAEAVMNNDAGEESAGETPPVAPAQPQPRNLTLF
jgi:hypothetical protein